MNVFLTLPLLIGVVLPAWAGNTEQPKAILPELPTHLPPAYPGGEQGSETTRQHYVAAMVNGAKNGNPTAQLSLAIMYEKGIGVSKNEAEAANWYRKVAAQESAQQQSTAQAMLGLMYADGRGVNKDDAEALKCFGEITQKRYEHLFSESDRMIMMQLRLLGDKSKIVERYQKEAESGRASGQAMLGDIYAKAFGVSKDEAEAIKWYTKAAEQGSTTAQYSLGFMYAEGHGVLKNEKEAMKWYRKATEQEAASLETVVKMGYEYGPM